MRNPEEEDSTGASPEKRSPPTTMRLICAPDRVVLAASAISRVMKAARKVRANVGDLWDSMCDAASAIECAAESVAVASAIEAAPLPSVTDDIANARADRVLKRHGFSAETNK